MTGDHNFESFVLDKSSGFSLNMIIDYTVHKIIICLVYSVENMMIYRIKVCTYAIKMTGVRNFGSFVLD